MSDTRQCVCGVPIPKSRIFCCVCRKEYTLDRKLWPAWLTAWMSNYQAELDYERRHGVLEVSLSEFEDDGDDPEDTDCN